MLRDVDIYLYVTLVAAILYWACPRQSIRARGGLLTAVSCLFVYMLSPTGLLLTLAMTASVMAGLRSLDRGRGGGAMAIGGIVALLAGGGMLFPESRAPLATLGVSFVAVKSIGLIMDRMRNPGPGPSLGQVLLLNTFFPIYTAGPIERADAFSPERLGAAFDPSRLVAGLLRLAVGLFKIAFLSQTLVNGYIAARYPHLLASGSQYSPLETLGFMYLRFLSLYLNFSGYTDVAIGTGAVFGLSIRENFRRPYLARSIQEFWQRWHLSLADFVFRYLFVTLARRTRGRVELSIFLSFVLIGLWHGVSVGYLVWGVCHGLALVGAARYKQAARARPAWDRLRRSRLHAVAGWALTMTLVAFLSTFANAGGLNASLVLVRHLLGMAP